MRDLWHIGSSAAGWVVILAVFAFWSHLAAAQSNPFDRYDVPPLVNNFMGGAPRGLEREFQADIHVLGAFDGRRSVDRYTRSEEERAQPWRFYGRLGPMYFQNQLEGRAPGFQFSFQRQGPSLTGRGYVGIYRTFD
jgi:4-amino-4-deoxy-L-arabinose transferase-like glycosyltransferase